MSRKIAAIALSLGCLNANSALALGLGDLKLESFLNEPLKAHVSLLNTGNLHEDQIRIRLATRDDFEKLGVERAYFLTSIKFEVKLDDNGRGQIIVTSDDPVLEPYLDFIVEARWPSGRLLREYTVLVDPPVFDESAQVVSATARVIEVDGEQALVSDLKKKETESTVGRSGTHVDVRQSSLPAGQMPDRNFGSQAAGAPAPGQRYMIRRDDTLWEIAQQAQPQGASVHQTMLDIQRLNPRAFIDGNINRIKAGYIIYLPSSAEISSQDQAVALASVKQQNEDWRSGRASEPYSAGGPSLRISADEGEESLGFGGQRAYEGSEGASGGGSTARRSAGDLAAAPAPAATGDAAVEDLEKADLEQAEMEERLGSMEQQVETLQRIVNLKDEQISALQAALAEAGAESAAVEDGLPLESPADLEAVAEEAEALDAEETGEDSSAEAVDSLEGLVDRQETEEAVQEEAGEDSAGKTDVMGSAEAAVAEAEPKAVSQPASKPATASAAAEESGGMLSYVLYGLGALLLAILGLVLLRRRGGDDDEVGVGSAVADDRDVFADVELKDQELDVASVDSAEPDAVADESEAEPEPVPTRDNRGYGEKKHDEYAADVDTSDAIAEADIYVAYGRYPQAVDLLKNAAASEPENATYQLKLMEVYAEMGDRDGVMQHLANLEKIGDAAALSRAEEVLAGMDARAAAPQPAPMQEAPEAPAPGQAVAETQPEIPASVPPQEEMAPEAELPMDSEFGGLEIEEAGSEPEVADELDLSEDFVSEAPAVEEGEDLVIAAEANGLSTKLDLARAYLDMGDEDGARQILEEVEAEGSDDLKAEARALLDRIG